MALSSKSKGALTLILYFLVKPAWAFSAIEPTKTLVLEDKYSQLTINSITSPVQAEKFHPLKNILSQGYSRSTYWLKLSYPPEKLSNKELWLEIQPPYLDDITVYIPNQNGWIEKKGGDHIPQINRELPYRGSVFRMTEWEGNEVYLRLKTTSSSIMVAKLWTPESFSKQKQIEHGILGFYYGIFTLLFIVILLQGAWRYDTTHRLYLLNMLMTIAFLLGVNGLVGSYLFTETAWIPDHWTSFFSMFGCATTALFYEKLLEIKKQNVTLFILFRTTFWLATLAAISPALDIYTTIASKVHFIVTSMAITALLRSIWLCHKKKSKSKAIIMGHTFFLMGILSAILTLLGILPGYIWLLHGPQIGNILSMLVFGFVLVQNIREALDQKKDAEQRAKIAELEKEKEQRIQHEHSYLVDMLSHELKTPLGMIDGALQTLVKLNPHSSTEEAKRYQRIKKGVTRIDNLVNQLLHYEKLDDGSLKPKISRIELYEFFNEMISNYSINNRITLDCEPETHLNADYTLLSICIGNLITNALRYCPATTSIIIKILPQDDEITITVKDNGPGIEESIKDSIFERYVRGTNTGNSEGSGLGIYISRRIANLHLGSLNLVDSPEGGACFRLTLPKTHNQGAHYDSCSSN